MTTIRTADTCPLSSSSHARDEHASEHATPAQVAEWLRAGEAMRARFIERNASRGSRLRSGDHVLADQRQRHLPLSKPLRECRRPEQFAH
jgi:hypothetical protein